MVSGFQGAWPAGSGENANASSGTSTPSARASARRRRKPLLEQLAGQQVQRQDAALAVLGRLLDALALLDQVVAGQADLLAGEVEPVLAQEASSGQVCLSRRSFPVTGSVPA